MRLLVTSDLIWLAIATASIAYTLTKTVLFEGVRQWWKKDGLMWHLWQCPYCMSHWIAFFFVLLFRPMTLTGMWIDLIASAFIVITIAAFLTQLMVIGGKTAAILTNLAE